ncbi:hypothetical protein T07_6625 [Trichinella nelsoni]|uniref:Uncharacterized protein n=1 Tax=Trichinella nelsoni TaxID=6336 RepID=A0A0V0S4W2_9BILA|nr:hypothetical protein T07_6625 [Trichinella nelsoni]
MPDLAPNAISFDEMLRKLPQMFQMANDMHNLTEYISQMRILFMLMTVLGMVGSVVYLLIRMKKKQKAAAMRYHRCDGDADTIARNNTRPNDAWNPHHPRRQGAFSPTSKVITIPSLPENSSGFKFLPSLPIISVFPDRLSSSTAFKTKK